MSLFGKFRWQAPLQFAISLCSTKNELTLSLTATLTVNLTLTLTLTVLHNELTLTLTLTMRCPTGYKKKLLELREQKCLGYFLTHRDPLGTFTVHHSTYYVGAYLSVASTNKLIIVSQL